MCYYYIPNLDDVLKSSKKKLPSKIKGKNIVEISTEEDRQFLIKSIEAKEYATDRELIESLKNHFPDIENKMSSGNISVSELRTWFEEVFTDLPDELFQDENIVKVFKNIINFIVKKNEITFVIENISNNTLKYDLNYKFGKIYDFYFYMVKAYHDSTNLFSIMRRLQSVIQKIYLKNIIFNDSKNKLNHIQALNRSFNVMGNISVEYRDKLDLMVKEIKDYRNWLKRTKIKPPKGYNSQEILVLAEFDRMIKEMDEGILKLTDAKKKIGSEILKRKFTLKKALDWWGRIRSFLP